MTKNWQPLKGSEAGNRRSPANPSSDGKRINALDAPRISRLCRPSMPADARRRKPEIVPFADYSVMQPNTDF
ncbi:MAG TPA: hypothetical protein VF309_07140 [Usitatibacter sp.]